jgi:5-methylcytosine-specific restriction endonuclease McrA
VSDEKEKKEHVVLASGKTMTKKTWIMSGLRRMSYRWPAKNQAERNARVERGRYKCATCGELFKAGEYAIDHIVPVISLKEAHTSWDQIMDTLFCDVDGFQILCHPCHDMKTSIEDSMRAGYNEKRKQEEKEQKKLDKKNKMR